MIYLSLIQNIAILTALTFVHSLMFRRLKRGRFVYPLLSGLLFGFVCIIGMMTPVTYQPGIIFDGRSIILSVAGLFAGPLAALVAGSIAAAYRLSLGGVGALPGVGVVIGTAGLGVVWHYLRQRYHWAMGTTALLIFGLLVHLLMFTILFLTLPEAAAHGVLNKVALPVLLLYPPATLLTCMLFMMMEQYVRGEERMRLFFEHQLVGMAITTPEKGWEQVNDKLCLMLGYNREELATMSWAELTHPEDLPRDLDNFNRILSGEINGYSIEKRFIHKDGSIIYTNLSVGCVRHYNGSVDYVLALLEDISTRKLLRLKHEENQRFLQTILDSISDFIFYKDRNGIYLGCNNAYASRYIGLPKDSIIGHPGSDFIPDKNLIEKYEESDLQAMEASSPTVVKPLITLANGQKALLEVVKTPFHDSDGHVAGVIGVARDITEHNLALEAITREKETAQRYLDITGVLICALNRAGEIILINKKGSRILGYRDDELLGQNWFDVCLPEPVRKKVKELFAAQLVGDIIPFEFYENSVITRSGEERLIFFHNTLLHDEEGVSGILFSGEDVTEQRLMQDELLKNQKLESLSVLAGGIAHDFNNILTGIMGNISFARMSLATPEKAQHLLENAEKASLRAASLAAQLLTFAKGGKPIKKRVSVGALLEESLSLSLRGANVKGVLEIPESLHPVEADEGQLSQVFNNLIINALQAMPGGGTLTIRAENITIGDQNIALLPPDEYVKLTFTDQGCGIPEEDQKKIFDPYFTTKSEGSGLGLASTHSIISKHDGRIVVNSVVGKGTTFTIYLHSLGATDAEKKHMQNDPLATTSHATGAILVLDDEELVRDLATDVLEYLGYQVKTCITGEEAITMYKTAKESGEPFFAAIMDLTIPGGMGGREAAQKILDYDPSACLIVSSGYSNDPVIAEYRHYGFSAAITKPYKVNNITEVLTELSNRI
ncbi:MAG: PAS domain S-box protein [Desulfuromonadaceae bacterium]|nr:PAS domain S-box protein [Desulfuromonadaceae bacterium]MDD2849491.1 PAS domain S-box protein [Desulfuromonadaceae bacterium]MDD4130495.1 PAS domain S-box protein [Desulfuromonadaceae bacterium]